MKLLYDHNIRNVIWLIFNENIDIMILNEFNNQVYDAVARGVWDKLYNEIWE